MSKKNQYTFDILDNDENTWYSFENYIEARKYQIIKSAEILLFQNRHNLTSQSQYEAFMTYLMNRYVVNEPDKAKKIYNESIFRVVDWLITEEYKSQYKNT